MPSDVNKLSAEVHAYSLDVFPGYFGLSGAQQERGYNGVGPDSWSPWERAALTWITPILEPAAFIHDLEATYANDGTRAGFDAWNSRFRRNGIITVRREVAWWRFLARQALYDEVEFAYSKISGPDGWEAWQAAYKAEQA